MCRFCVLIGGFQGSCCGIFAVLSGDMCPALPAIFLAAGGMSFRFSANIGLMCGYLLLFHDSFIIFHVKNNAVQHAYYYHNTFAPHCFCGLTGREVFCAVMEVPAQIFGLFVRVGSCCMFCRVLHGGFCCGIESL